MLKESSMQLFVDLGATVESRWRQQHYNEDVFPDIAAQSLLDSNLTERVDPREIIRWIHNTPELPRQLDRKGSFGNPPITLSLGIDFTSTFTFGSKVLLLFINTHFREPFRCYWEVVSWSGSLVRLN
jgi:hypothetical protein